jgi:Sulfotransferase domain
VSGAPPRLEHLPNFVVVGAMKAGTTSLYHYLRPHPQVFMPKIKELDFFADGMNWARGLDWYRHQFATAPREAVALGEASTVYTKFPRYDGVAERMAKVVPDVRLIYVVRHPIDRIRSHYEHRVASGAETAPMEDAVFENPIYIDYSRYALQVEQYLEHFPREQLLIVSSEELRHHRESTMRRVYGFLAVDPDYLAPTLGQEFYKTGQRRTYPPVVWSVRQTLKRRFPQTKRAKELVDSIASRRRRVPIRTAATFDERSRQSPSTDRARDLSDRARCTLEDLLRDDIGRLRSYMTDTFDGWGIA